MAGLKLSSATHDSEMNTISSPAFIQIKGGKTQVNRVQEQKGQSNAWELTFCITLTQPQALSEHQEEALFPSSNHVWSPEVMTKKIFEIWRPVTKFIQNYFFAF